MFRPYFITCALLLSLGTWADNRTLRDPTRPDGFAQSLTGVSGKTMVSLPRLSSVLIGDERRLAVIDGRVMAVGDVSNGIRVRSINRDRVVVTMDSRTPVTLLLDTVGIHKEVR